MYLRLPIISGSIKGVPTKVAMARDVPIVAFTIPLTNGNMLQAFRMSENGLEEIPIFNQPARTQYAVTVSPNGRWILTGLAISGQAGLALFEYNQFNNAYDFKRSYTNFVSSRPIDFEWLTEDVVVMGFTSFSNPASGTLRLDDVSGAGTVLNEITGVQYGINEIHRTSNNRNLVVGTWNAASLANIRTVVYNGTTRRIAVTTTSTFANGGPNLSMKKDGSRIVSSRPGSTNLQSASGVDAGFALSTTNVQNINNQFCSNIHINDTLVMTNGPGGVFNFYEYQPDNTLAEVPVPMNFNIVASIGKSLTWIKNTNYNGYLVGYDGSTADLWVYYPSNKYDAAIDTPLSGITTSGLISNPLSTNTTVELNQITSQLISGEDQSSTSLNLKLMPAYIQTSTQHFGRFSYESFNQQYMHGKTHFKQVITTDSTLFIEPQIDSDLLMPSPFVDGLIALPPQFEGDTNIAKFTTQASLKSDDFFSGDTLIGIKVVNEGRISGGETIESFAFINSILSDGILKSEIGFITDTLIPVIEQDGLVKPNTAIYGDTRIPVIKSDGFVNNPWTIDSDTLIPNKFVMGGWVNNPYLSTSEITLPSIVTTSFIANGEEGVLIQTMLSSLFNDFVAQVILPEELSGDVAVGSIETDVVISASKNLTGDTVIPSFDTEGFLQKTIELDSVVDLPKFISDGFLEIVNSVEIDTRINRIQTDVLLEFLRRRRYLNII